MLNDDEEEEDVITIVNHLFLFVLPFQMSMGICKSTQLHLVNIDV